MYHEMAGEQWWVLILQGVFSNEETQEYINVLEL